MKKIKSYYIPKEDKNYEIYFSKHDHYQEAQRNRALAHVNKWYLAIDIGANIGLWARDLTSFFNGSSREPSDLGRRALMSMNRLFTERISTLQVSSPL